MARQTTKTRYAIEAVGAELEKYAQKRIFRGLSPAYMRNGRATFRIVWHFGRPFECIVDPKRKTIRFPVVLPEVPKNSAMDRAFKDYVKERHNPDRPEHRRIDTAKAEVKAYNRGGHASLTLSVRDGDFRYGIRKLIHLIQEIYLDFLRDGLWYDYMIETFDLDPDNPVA